MTLRKNDSPMWRVIFLNMFEEQCDEDGLADESVLELYVTVFTGEEVVEEEMDFAEGSEGFGVEDVAEPNEHVWENASANGCSKGEVCGIGANQEYGHHHVPQEHETPSPL